MDRKMTWAAAAILTLAPLEADAATLAFSFGTSDATFLVSGDVTVDDTLKSMGGYDVTGISGTVSGPNGGAITGLIANPIQPFPYNQGSWIFDNVVFSSGPWVDYWGLLFTAGGYDYNLFSSGSAYYLSSYNPAGSYSGEVGASAALTAIPEPAPWLMIGLGFVALGAAGGRASRGDSRAAFA